MKAQGLMEDHAKNLKFHKEKLLQLVLVLDTLFGDLKVVVDQQKKVDLEQTLVEAFQNFHRWRNSRLFVTEQKFLICRQNYDVAKTLFSKFQMGLAHWKVVVALPSNLVSMNDVVFQKFLMVERCPFCGLGFALMWACKLTSCNISTTTSALLFILTLQKSASS